MSFFSRASIHFSGQKRSALDLARGRIVIISAIFVLFYIVVVARVVDLSLIQGEMKRVEEVSSYVSAPRDEQKVIRRGDIVDRNGVILARSLKTASLYADPAIVHNPEELARELVRIFPELSYGDVLQRLQSNRRFVWIKRNMTPDDQYKILYLGHPALAFKEEYRRLYPQGNLLSHIVGYTNIDEQGLAGLERGFDKFLNEQESPLMTTLDVRVQHALYRELSAAMKEFNAIGATGLVMEVNSGEVIAAISLPDFDPQAVDVSNKNALFNRISLGVFEPGSTFKIFTLAAALESGKADISTKFDVRESMRVGGFNIRDYYGQKRIMTMPEVFMHSSNIGAAQMAQMVGTENFRNFLSDLGLFRAPEVEVPEAAAPLLPKTWREINTLTISYGHGIAISPLHLVSAASSILNGGILVNPTLVRDRTLKESRSSKNSVRVVSEKTAHRVRQMLRLVVTDGSAKRAEIAGYNVGGKTGTAEKPSEHGGYDRHRLRSAFLSFFPIEQPKYAIYVMLDEPKGTKDTHGFATAGWVAVPAAGRVIESIAAIEGLKPQSNDELGGTLSAYVKTKEEIQRERQLAAITHP